MNPITRIPLDVLVAVPASDGKGEVYLASFYASEPQFAGDPYRDERIELLLRTAWRLARDNPDNQASFTLECERLRALHQEARR